MILQQLENSHENIKCIFALFIKTKKPFAEQMT